MSEDDDVLVWLRSVAADSGDRLWDAIDEIERLRAGLREIADHGTHGWGEFARRKLGEEK